MEVVIVMVAAASVGDDSTVRAVVTALPRPVTWDQVGMMTVPLHPGSVAVLAVMMNHPVVDPLPGNAMIIVRGRVLIVGTWVTVVDEVVVVMKEMVLMVVDTVAVVVVVVVGTVTIIVMVGTTAEIEMEVVIVEAVEVVVAEAHREEATVAETLVHLREIDMTVTGPEVAHPATKPLVVGTNATCEATDIPTYDHCIKETLQTKTLLLRKTDLLTIRCRLQPISCPPTHKHTNTNFQKSKIAAKLSTDHTMLSSSSRNELCRNMSLEEDSA